MAICPVCGQATQGRTKFCGRACLREAYRKGFVVNKGLLKRGSQSLKKERILESWVGEERAREIKARMSLNSAKRALHLNRLNKDLAVLEGD
jgi:hypothetical protein